MPVVGEPDFEPRGVLVLGPGGVRCSGVLLSEGDAEGCWVLTSGLALGSSLFHHPPMRDLPFGQLLLPDAVKCCKLQLSVIMEKPPAPSTAPRGDEVAKAVSWDASAIERRATVAAMWRCALLELALRSLLKEWKFSAVEPQKKDSAGRGGELNVVDERTARSTLPLLVVLRVGDSSIEEKNFSTQELLTGATSVLSSLLHRLQANGVGGSGEDGGWWRGRRLLLESCPFGNTIFFNAWSEGVVGGAAGPQGCILVADTRAGPGCEGAPAFLLCPSSSSPAARPDRRIGPVALTMTAVSWWRGEWVGFTLLAALTPVLRSLLRVTSVPPGALLQTSSTGKGVGGADAALDAGAATAAEAGLVLVRCGGEWGSGVVIALSDPASPQRRPPARRLVLTCAHVVRHAPEPCAEEGGRMGDERWGTVNLWWRGRRLPSRLLFRSPAAQAFDIAVLELLEDERIQEWPTALPLAAISPAKGDRVMCAGFPLLADSAGSGPLVSGGRVANVSPGVMVQATCIAQAGASGGALLRPCAAGGAGVEVVGIVVSNIRDATSGILFPHFLLAAPADALHPPLCAFVSSSDVTTLKALTPDDVEMQRLWLLQPPKLHSTPPPARL